MRSNSEVKKSRNHEQAGGARRLRRFARAASSSLISPSPPSDGGEGWGEEACPYWFPLPLNPPLHPSQEGNQQPAPQTKLPSWEGLGVGSGAQCAIKVRGGLSSILSPLVPRRERMQSLMQPCRFAARMVLGVRKSQTCWTMKRPEGRAPFASVDSTSEFGMKTFCNLSPA